jgi:hypothetical protein
MEHRQERAFRKVRESKINVQMKGRRSTASQETPDIAPHRAEILNRQVLPSAGTSDKVVTMVGLERLIDPVSKCVISYGIWLQSLEFMYLLKIASSQNRYIYLVVQA